MLGRRHTVRSHLWQSLANYIQQGTALLLSVILSRILTPSDFGEFAYASANVLLCLLPVAWSLASLVVADGGHTPELTAQALRFGWWVVGAKAVLVLGLVAALFFTGHHLTAGLCLLIGLPESLREMNNVQRATLEGAGLFRQNFMCALLGGLFSLILMIPAARMGWGPYALVFPSFIALIVEYWIFLRVTKRSIFIKPGFPFEKKLFRNGFWLWINGLSETAYARVDKWFAGKIFGAEVLGFYNRAFNFAPLSHLFLNSLMTNPTVVALVRCENAKARRCLFFKTAFLLGLAGAANWIFYAVASKPVILLLFGRQWLGAVPYFQAFAPLSLCYSIAYLPAAVLMATKRFHILALVRVADVGLFLGCLLAMATGITPITLAILLQAYLVVQGLVSFWFCHDYFFEKKGHDGKV